MTFFDELNKRINGLTQSAQKTADIARLQRQVNQKQDEFGALFSEIGKLYYDCRQRDVQPAEAMEILCGKVDSLAAEIAGLKLKLDDMREIRRCPSCGSVQNNTNRFCAHCGTQLEVDVPEDDEDPSEEETETSGDAQEENENGVYINWPEAGQQSDEASSDDSTDDSSDDDSSDDSGSDDD